MYTTIKIYKWLDAFITEVHQVFKKSFFLRLLPHVDIRSTFGTKKNELHAFWDPKQSFGMNINWIYLRALGKRTKFDGSWALNFDHWLVLLRNSQKSRIGRSLEGAGGCFKRFLMIFFQSSKMLLPYIFTRIIPTSNGDSSVFWTVLLDATTSTYRSCSFSCDLMQVLLFQCLSNSFSQKVYSKTIPLVLSYNRFQRCVSIFICCTKKNHSKEQKVSFYENLRTKLKIKFTNKNFRVRQILTRKLYRASVFDLKNVSVCESSFLKKSLISNWISSKYSEYETFSKYSRWEKNAIKKSRFGPYYSLKT